MSRKPRLLLSVMAGLGIGLTTVSGCQTYPAGFGGMTLPSGHYLEHFPQYFPPEPVFPLQGELDSMQDQAIFGAPGGIVPLDVAPLPNTAIPAAPPPGSMMPGGGL